MGYRIIDAHAHIFPAKIAAKAVASIGDFYDLPMHDDGTSESLLESGAKIGTQRYLVCSTATTPAQVCHINDFIYEECRKHPEFIGFATMHPDFEDMDAEFERIFERGYYGIKLHPDFQKFNIDDEKAMEIYRRAEGKLTVLFHTGDDRYEFSKPHRLAEVCDRFPDLKCIAAHFGGYRDWAEAYEVYHSRNIYMDTSSSLFSLDRATACRFFEHFGIDHFFWGTDFPMWTHEQEFARIQTLGLSESELQAVFADNFEQAILGGNSSGLNPLPRVLD